MILLLENPLPPPHSILAVWICFTTTCVDMVADAVEVVDVHRRNQVHVVGRLTIVKEVGMGWTCVMLYGSQHS